MTEQKFTDTALANGWIPVIRNGTRVSTFEATREAYTVRLSFSRQLGPEPLHIIELRTGPVARSLSGSDQLIHVMRLRESGLRALLPGSTIDPDTLDQLIDDYVTGGLPLSVSIRNANR